MEERLLLLYRYSWYQVHMICIIRYDMLIRCEKLEDDQKQNYGEKLEIPILKRHANCCCLLCALMLHMESSTNPAKPFI